jgi:phage shock protein A
MGIFQRTGDMISATLSDLLEQFEHPEKMLRQALRDMEHSVSTVSAAVARSIAAERLLAREQERHNGQAAFWAGKAVTTVAAGNDASARRALAHKLEYQRLAQSLDRQLVDARASNQELRLQVDALREKHASARRQLSALLARQSAADARRRFRTGAPGIQSAQVSLTRFEHFREKIELAEAEAFALAELELGIDNIESSEFDIDDRTQAIESELAALKERPKA